MDSPPNATRNQTRIAGVCIVFAAVVFGAGYMLGKQIHEPAELPPSPTPPPAIKQIPRIITENALGHPLGTVVDISGEIYIDGAGFPMDWDRMQVYRVNGKEHHADITVSGGRLPENGTVHFRGYEAIERQKNYRRIDGKGIPDPDHPWRFERRFVVLETVADNSEKPQK